MQVAISYPSRYRNPHQNIYQSSYPNSNQNPNQHSYLSPYPNSNQIPYRNPNLSPYQSPTNAYQSNLSNVPSIPPKSSVFESKSFCVISTIVITILLAAAITVPIVIAMIKSVTTTTTGTTTTSTSTTTITTTTTTTSVTTTTSQCGATYSQSFTGGSSSSSQCSAWTSFLSGLTCTTYTSLTLYGSNNPAGINITSSGVATAIVTALRNGGTYSGSSNGYTWRVGTCGGGSELSATGTICSCPSGYTIRPCIGNSNWGGINSATCGASSQTMSLYVQ